MIAQVLQLPTSPTGKVLLLAMMQCADPQTGEVARIVPELARDIRMNQRTVRKTAVKLAREGFVELVSVGGGRSRPNRYRVTV